MTDPTRLLFFNVTMNHICRICLNEFAGYQYGPFNEEYMSFLLPEMILTKVKDPIACAQCLVGLTSAYNLKQRCLTNEKRIQNFRRLYVTSDVVDLRQMLLYKENNFAETDSPFIETKCKLNILNEFNRNNENGVPDAYVFVKPELLGNSKTSIVNENPTVSENRLETGIVCVKVENDVELITANLEKRSVKEATTDDKNKSKDRGSLIEENLAESDINNSIVNMPIEEVQKKELVGIGKVTPFNSNNNSIKREKQVSKCGLFYKCNECGYQSKHSGAMLQHVARHDPEKKFKCQFCEYKSYRKQNVKVHISTKHSGKFLKCSQCEYQSVLRHRIQSHMRIHSKERPYRCNNCNYSSCQKESLKKHLLNHNRNAPFKCYICDFSAFTGSHVVTHQDKYHNQE